MVRISNIDTDRETNIAHCSRIFGGDPQMYDFGPQCGVSSSVLVLGGRTVECFDQLFILIFMWSNPELFLVMGFFICV